MRKYQVTFEGRLINAIGCTYTIMASVEAEDRQAARLKLYDKYDHITLDIYKEVSAFLKDAEVIR